MTQGVTNGEGTGSPSSHAPLRPLQEAGKSKAQFDREFSELYRAHLRDVYSYAYYRVGNHHDAEDLTEQTFLQAYRHFERAQRESGGRPLRPWLIRIAHNLAANLYRDRSRRPASSIEDTEGLSALHTTEELVENRAELARVLAGVQTLPDDRREALIMRFALDMDNREIARALGRSDGATKVLIHRAIKQLEALVADTPDSSRGADAAPAASAGDGSVPAGKERSSADGRAVSAEGANTAAEGIVRKPS